MTRRRCLVLLLVACMNCNDEAFGREGTDRLVAEYNYDGAAVNCWKLTKDGRKRRPIGLVAMSPDGHTAAGRYERVEVKDGNWASAATKLQVDLKACK